jgi:glycosyltransferase involved in cell wall biosynthesis
MQRLEELPTISRETNKPLKLLVLAPNCDGTDVGEAWRAFKWVKSLEDFLDITLLTFQRQGRIPVQDQFESVKVVSWPEPVFGNERLAAMLKPAYINYFRLVKKWLQKEKLTGRGFDVAHQLTPAALRYPSPLIDEGIPYILGPVAGSLNTPEAFKDECANAPWFTRLRELDRFRLRFDPVLKRSYEQASMIIGVGQYVEDLLSHMKLKQLVLHSEMAIDELAPLPIHKKVTPGNLTLLHVGRGVRTKGLRDIIRALAKLKDLDGIKLHSVGDGEETNYCKQEARHLGVEDRVVFHGHLKRQEVEQLYANSDLFVFPSFREPCGRVLSESMRWGLPVLTVNTGGPGNTINNTCGITVSAITPDQLATDLAEKIREVSVKPFLLVPLRDGARRRVATEGLWHNKAIAMFNAYQSISIKNQIKETA